PQPSNHMNSSLTSLYRKGQPDSNTPARDAAADPGPSSLTSVSTGGWFIDRRGCPEGISLDSSEEQPRNKSTDVRSKVMKALTVRNCFLGALQSHKRPPLGLHRISPVFVLATCVSAKSKSAELQYPSLKFEDVGGNEETLTELCKLLIHMRHPEVYQQLGMVPPRGFLLHGPPGCGKTLLAQAVAGELQLPMLKVSAPEVVSGVSGESEQKLRQLFDQAVSSAPCILFIDEIDAITPKREVASKDMERRIVAQMLTCMDDLNTLPAPVMVIGATNRPDSLDPALRRAGRFDREICLGIPDEAARLRSVWSVRPGSRRPPGLDALLHPRFPPRILKTLCRKLKLSEDFDHGQLARLTPGYVGADLMALCREAAMSAVSRALITPEGSPSGSSRAPAEHLPAAGCEAGPQTGSADADPGAHAQPAPERPQLLELLKRAETLSEERLGGLSILMADFQASLASVQPSAKREGFATVPDVTWEDVGALQDIREELTMAILAPVRFPEQFKVLGLSAPSGVLLTGPPGCGKTLLAKYAKHFVVPLTLPTVVLRQAVANESGLNFISVKGPELLNMLHLRLLADGPRPSPRTSVRLRVSLSPQYVGESERAVRQVFRRAQNSAPCVIFFDEIDALCPRRSGHDSGASVRVVNQLLTEMDGLEARRQVFLMAATNRPDIIDPAILRPGRLDKILYVGLPSAADRHSILLTITKGGTRPLLEQNVSLEEIALDQRCDGFTGADLTALVREASVGALRAYVRAQPPAPAPAHRLCSDSFSEVRVSRQNFDDAFRKVCPSVSKKV
ncbi:unnamed protein product, partial [Tetraodon nigroviridis]